MGGDDGLPVVAVDGLPVVAVDGLPVVAAGDFNSSPGVQGQQRDAQRFLQRMRDERGLVSAYHHRFGEVHGAETRASPIRMYRKRPFATHRPGRRQTSPAVCRIPCRILCVADVERVGQCRAPNAPYLALRRSAL